MTFWLKVFSTLSSTSHPLLRIMAKAMRRRAMKAAAPAAMKAMRVMKKKAAMRRRAMKAAAEPAPKKAMKAMKAMK